MSCFSMHGPDPTRPITVFLAGFDSLSEPCLNVVLFVQAACLVVVWYSVLLYGARHPESGFSATCLVHCAEL
jgi:hypothetical protein